MATVKVATWNLREGVAHHDRNRDRRRPAAEMVRMVADHDPGVLMVQEVCFDRNGRSQMLERMSAATNLSYVVSSVLSPSAYSPHHQSGVAVLSAFPIISSTPFVLPNPGLTARRGDRAIRSYDKGMLTCRVDLSGAVIRIASLHLFPFHRFERAAGEPAFRPVWQAIARQLSDDSDTPLIVAGDFNTSRRDLLLAEASHTLLRAVGDTPTHGGEPIDDILYSQNLTLVAPIAVVENFSDHQFCVAEFVLG
jgi:endonuclease/exonuclease/phosphatase family metal-dependent hydrolase